MLIFDLRAIGNKLLAIRKKAGLTQSEVAEAANLSDRTYADIERGTVNMRIETALRICEAPPEPGPDGHPEVFAAAGGGDPVSDAHAL